MSGAAAPARSPQRRPGIDAVAVVMPAHNEDQHIDRALRAVQRAADELQRQPARASPSG